jgi:hypothetical protein
MPAPPITQQRRPIAPANQPNYDPKDGLHLENTHLGSGPCCLNTDRVGQRGKEDQSKHSSCCQTDLGNKRLETRGQRDGWQAYALFEVSIFIINKQHASILSHRQPTRGSSIRCGEDLKPPLSWRWFASLPSLPRGSRTKIFALSIAACFFRPTSWVVLVGCAANDSNAQHLATHPLGVTFHELSHRRSRVSNPATYQYHNSFR